MPTKKSSIHVEALIKISNVQPSPTSIDIYGAGWIQIGPSMCITTHKSDRKVPGQTIINADRETSCGEIVTLSQALIVDIDEISETCNPYAPSILRSRLQSRWGNLLSRLSFNGPFA